MRTHLIVADSEDAIDFLKTDELLGNGAGAPDAAVELRPVPSEQMLRLSVSGEKVSE